MKKALHFLSVCLLFTVAAWALPQVGSSQVPKRKAHAATAHKMPPHAARRLSQRERQERKILRDQQRSQAKLAKKQRKQARKRSRRLRNSHPKVQ